VTPTREDAIGRGSGLDTLGMRFRVVDWHRKQFVVQRAATQKLGMTVILLLIVLVRRSTSSAR
jgi:hypothetical protein